jgi:hypothetical protein
MAKHPTWKMQPRQLTAEEARDWQARARKAEREHKQLLAMLQRMIEYYDYDKSESDLPPSAKCPCRDARGLIERIILG